MCLVIVMMFASPSDGVTIKLSHLLINEDFANEDDRSLDRSSRGEGPTRSMRILAAAHHTQHVRLSHDSVR
jgi:hypothetical protein